MSAGKPSLDPAMDLVWWGLPGGKTYADNMEYKQKHKGIRKKKERKSYYRYLLRRRATLFKEFKELNKGTLTYYLAHQMRILNTAPLQVHAHKMCGEIETYVRDCCFQKFNSLDEIEKTCRPAYEEYLACALRIKSTWWNKLVNLDSESDEFKNLARLYTYRLVTALSSRDFIPPEYSQNFTHLKVCRTFFINKRRNLTYLKAITWNRWQRFASKLSNYDWRSYIFKNGKQKYNIIQDNYNTKLQNFNLRIFSQLGIPIGPPQIKKKGQRKSHKSKYKKKNAANAICLFFTKTMPRSSY